MKYRRKQQLTIILVLVAAISTISIGFAAFSATLNISSSASVTPNSDDFEVKFYQSAMSTYAAGHGSSSDGDTYVYSEAIGGATASSVVLNSSTTSLSGLKASFTKPGQSVTYIVYAGNTGTYDAYLREINFLNVSGQTSNKVCTPGDGTTASLVEAACNAITMTVRVDETTFTNTKTLSNHILYTGSFEPIYIRIAYSSNGARADGPFNVEFGGVSLDYSTADNRIITFTADGIQCQTTAGTTWLEYINSSDNTSGIYYNTVGGNIYSKSKSMLRYIDDDRNAIAPTTNDVILEGTSYFTGIPTHT